ncbi:MAG: hypothetical protein Q4C46_03090 [Bacillota bacterium]|nr:hypothetical protein [Bacillota bacterium]
MTNRKRTVGINIRVTPQEKKRIVRFAKKCRLSVSEYIRQLAEGYTPQQLPGQELYEVLWELQKLQDDYNAENLNRTIGKLTAYLFEEREGDSNGND